MSAGKRNVRILVQRYKQTAVPDQGGHIDESDPNNWETATEIGDNGGLWAYIVPRTSREFVRADQVIADVTHQVELDYQSAKGLKDKMRLRDGDRVFNVAGPPVNVEERNQVMRLTVVEVF